MPDVQDDPDRGTGRTTGLMIKVIADAVQKPWQDITFKDHAPYNGHRAKMFAAQIEAMAKALGLTMEVNIFAGDVLVMSKPPGRRT